MLTPLKLVLEGSFVFSGTRFLLQEIPNGTSLKAAGDAVSCDYLQNTAVNIWTAPSSCSTFCAVVVRNLNSRSLQNLLCNMKPENSFETNDFSFSPRLSHLTSVSQNTQQLPTAASNSRQSIWNTGILLKPSVWLGTNVSKFSVISFYL